MEPELAPAVLLEAELGEEPLALSSLASTQPHGKVTGSGRLVLKSGCIYEGQLENSRMHGTGTLTFPDGLQYQGEFQQNVIQGTGVYQWPGGTRYEGEVQCGLRHGKGRMTFTDSATVYEGSWHRGLRHGHGKITFNKEGTHWYEGEWQNDQKWGQGVMRYANGDRYEGSWVQDVKCGHGVMSWDSRKERYEGQWAHNSPNGVGTHTWFQQLVTEPSPSNHALLVLFNRYEGHFLEGARHGYGVLHYATGARYEGCCVKDLKQGAGIVVFENGEVWQGHFADDQPVLGEGEVFAPKGPGLSMQVDDLIDEEEVPAAAARGLANVLMVYNTDLRSLYDKYCKRPSLHLRNTPRPSFTMVSCQVWELLGDVRLITAATPLTRVNELLALARRPPAALTAFRAVMRPALQSQHTRASSEADDLSAVWWEELCQGHGDQRMHDPMQELLFREFAELLVRLAAVRYRHVPGLERRLHTLINVHLLHQVSKNKSTLPPPPRTPFHLEMWAGNATAVLHASAALLRQAWSCVGTSLSLPEPAADSMSTAADGLQLTADSLQADTQRAKEQQQDAMNNSAGAETMLTTGAVSDTTTGSGHDQNNLDSLATVAVQDSEVYGNVKSVRQALQLLQELGLLASPAVAMQAAASMTFNYLTVNTYTFEPSRAKVELESAVAAPQTPPTATTDLTDGSIGVDASKQEGSNTAGGSGDGPQAGAVPLLADADAREVLCWLDQPMLYADWVEGVARVAQGVVVVPAPGQQGVGMVGGAGNSQEEVGGTGLVVPVQPAAGAGQQQEGVLHSQLRQFLSGPQGLQKSLNAALVHQRQTQSASA